MKTKLSIGLIVASILLLIFVAVDAQQGHGAGSGDRDQQMDRDYDRDMDRDRDVVGDRDYDRDRDQDRDRDRSSGHDQDQDRDRVQDRDRLHVTDPASLRNKDIYGSALMTEEELKQYRNQLTRGENPGARAVAGQRPRAAGAGAHLRWRVDDRAGAQ
jgi:hypothetical protein